MALKNSNQSRGKIEKREMKMPIPGRFNEISIRLITKNHLFTETCGNRSFAGTFFTSPFTEMTGDSPAAALSSTNFRVA
jgi:hypothetical protein